MHTADGPPKILIVHGGRDDAAQRYRCTHLQQQLSLYGIRADMRELRESLLPGDAGYDLVILHRIPLDRNVRKLIVHAQRRGAVVLFDTDDLVFDTSVLGWIKSLSSDRLKRALYKNEVEQCRATMGLADAALVSTDLLARRAATLRPTWVHRNAFSPEMLAASDEARAHVAHTAGKVAIGYASGTPTHDADFLAAKAALQTVLRQHPESELWIVGPLDLGDDWGDLGSRVKAIPFAPWQELPSLLAQFDINVAPLEANNPFCQAKSEIKYVEAGLVRIPTVASRVDAFEFAIRQGDNGFLAASQQDWVQALQRLISDAPFRREMGERAHADVLRRYHPAARSHELIGTLNEVGRRLRGRRFWPDEVTRQARRADSQPIALRVTPGRARGSRWLPARRALYALRYRGLRITLMQVWVYLHLRLAQVLHRKPWAGG